MLYGETHYVSWFIRRRLAMPETDSPDPFSSLRNRIEKLNDRLKIAPTESERMTLKESLRLLAKDQVRLQVRYRLAGRKAQATSVGWAEQPLSDSTSPGPAEPRETGQATGALSAPQLSSTGEIFPVDVPLRLSPEALAVITDLVDATGDDAADVIRKALGLYKLAIDAKLEGKAVGSADSADVLDTEFIGLDVLDAGQVGR
jgi:hypothetical protein